MFFYLWYLGLDDVIKSQVGLGFNPRLERRRLLQNANGEVDKPRC